MMRTLLFHPRPAVLTGSKFRREPVRPKEHQSADFADKFDDRTLLFDAFSVATMKFSSWPRRSSISCRLSGRWTSLRCRRRRSAHSASGIWIGTRRSALSCQLARSNLHCTHRSVASNSSLSKISPIFLKAVESSSRCRRTTNCNGFKTG